jgi:hypothetical protein
MKKAMLLTVVLIGGLLSIHARAQSQLPPLANTNWKLYIPDINDTLTIHIKKDSSYATTGTGDVVVRSACKLSGDTIAFTDVDGQYACPNATGKYKVSLSDDANTMTLTLIDDSCDGRANALNKVKLLRGAPPAAAAPQK